MFQRFYPDEWIGSVYSYDFQTAWEKGYRAVLFDVDNTLVPHGAPATQESIALFARLRKIGFSTCLMSNNKEPRVKSFAEKVDSPYLYKAGKPKRSGYRRAMEKTGTPPEQTMFMGDQLFTDVWGAKLSGIHCILTTPIDPKEEIQIVFKRYLERIVLFFYKKSNGIEKNP
jgi:hypothetical protein